MCNDITNELKEQTKQLKFLTSRRLRKHSQFVLVRINCLKQNN